MNNKATSARKGFLRFFWWTFSSAILLIVIIFLFINIGWIGYMPPIDELQNPINKYATEIYSSDLQVLGQYSKSKNNRIKTEYSQISKNVVNALVATEDVRFYEHSGIDGIALIRSFILTGILHHIS